MKNVKRMKCSGEIYYTPVTNMTYMHALLLRVVKMNRTEWKCQKNNVAVVIYVVQRSQSVLTSLLHRIQLLFFLWCGAKIDNCVRIVYYYELVLLRNVVCNYLYNFGSLCVNIYKWSIQNEFFIKGKLISIEIFVQNSKFSFF